MRTLVHATVCVLAGVGLLLSAANHPALAGKKTCTSTTLTLTEIEVPGNSETTSDETIPTLGIDEGDTVHAAAHVDESSPSVSSCDNGSGAVTVGTLTIEARENTNTTPHSYKTCSEGQGNVISIASGAPPQSGNYDTSAAPVGTIVGVVADYGGTNDLAGSNVCIDVEVLSTTSACSCEGLDPDVYIYATQASANGTTPGDNFAGSFNIRVKNCTGDDIGSIKVQGGAAGWLTYKDIDYANTSSFDEYNTKDTGGKSKGKNPYSAATNTIFSLIGSLDDGECKDIRITEAGLIDPNAAPGTNMFMSGPWSAAWDNEKSDYTGRVTFEVTDTP